MFCPKCGAYLRDTDLVQRNVKFAMGNVPVEYDARCPNCSFEIGRMSWGQFTVHPKLRQIRYDDTPHPPEKEGLIPPPPEMRAVLRPYSTTGRAQSTRKETAAPVPPTTPVEEPSIRLCPHCGQPWPEEKADQQKY